MSKIKEKILSKRISKYLKNCNGSAMLLGTIVASVVLAIIIGSTTSWFLSLNKSVNDTSESFSIQSAAYSEWNKIINGDFSSQIGSTQKTTVDGKYIVETTFSKSGKYYNGTCHVGEVAGNADQACLNTTIDVKDKDGKLLRTFNPVRLASQGSSVKSDSYPKYKLSQKYDSTTDTIQNFVDGKLKSAWTQYLFKSDGTKISVDNIFDLADQSVKNGSYPNKKIHVQYEQDIDKNGKLVYNKDGTPKMVIGGYVNGVRTPFASAISEVHIKPLSYHHIPQYGEFDETLTLVYFDGKGIAKFNGGNGEAGYELVRLPDTPTNRRGYYGDQWGCQAAVRRQGYFHGMGPITIIGRAGDTVEVEPGYLYGTYYTSIPMALSVSID